MSSVPFFLIFFVFVVIYAAWRGGGPERLTTSAFVLALAGTLYVGTQVPGNFREVPPALLLVDFLLLIVLCAVAVRANRWWPIPVAGCQLVAVLVHAGKLLEPAMIPNSYVFLIDIWSWPMVALLALGTWQHRRRLAEGIIVPDWKPSYTQRRFRTQEPPQQS